MSLYFYSQVKIKASCINILFIFIYLFIYFSFYRVQDMGVASTNRLPLKRILLDFANSG